MRRLMILAATVVVVVASVTAALCNPAYANTDASSPPVAKRQMIACMTQQMSASRTISYNEAARVCRDALKAQIANLASNTTKPGTAR
jgi:hypothetical protein